MLGVLQARTIIRDGHQAFIGSQSLRAPELDSRRELGVIIRDAKAARKLIETFESDWDPKRSTKAKEGKKEVVKQAVKDAATEAVHESRKP